MLLEIKIKNFLSFKEEVVFSLIADRKTNLEHNLIRFNNGIEDFNLLKSAVIFGSNASGKSNLFEIMNLVRLFILNSFKFDESELGFSCFQLDNYSKEQPTYIEINFILEGIRYQYSFSILNEEVHKEELYNFLKGRKKTLFKREKQVVKMDLNVFDIAAKAAYDNQNLRKNALFLTTVSTFNGHISQKIKDYFFKHIHVISGLEASGKQGEQYDKFIIGRIKKDDTFKKKIENFIKVADLGIESIRLKEYEVDVSSFPEPIQQVAKINGLSFDPIQTDIQTSHKVFDKNNDEVGKIFFDLKNQESEGTKQFLHLLGPIIDSLENGNVLFVDEMTSKLHPYISKFVVSLFNSEIYNKKNAQLIFNTHDTNLLDLELFRRDQIYFLEKNNRGESKIFSLNDFSERKDSNIEKKYLMGNFGAVPFIDNSQQLW